MLELGKRVFLLVRKLVLVLLELLFRGKHVGIAERPQALQRHRFQETVDLRLDSLGERLEPLIDGRHARLPVVAVGRLALHELVPLLEGRDIRSRLAGEVHQVTREEKPQTELRLSRVDRVQNSV